MPIPRKNQVFEFDGVLMEDESDALDTCAATSATRATVKMSCFSAAASKCAGPAPTPRVWVFARYLTKTGSATAAQRPVGDESESLQLE